MQRALDRLSVAERKALALAEFKRQAAFTERTCGLDSSTEAWAQCVRDAGSLPEAEVDKALAPIKAEYEAKRQAIQADVAKAGCP